MIAHHWSIAQSIHPADAPLADYIKATQYLRPARVVHASLPTKERVRTVTSASLQTKIEKERKTAGI